MHDLVINLDQPNSGVRLGESDMPAAPLELVVREGVNCVAFARLTLEQARLVSQWLLVFVQEQEAEIRS